MDLDDLPDDDDWCDQCGVELPADRLYGRRRFCSEGCRKAWHQDQARRKREAARAGRTCDHCGTAIPAHWHCQTRFCCHGCKVQWWSDYHGRRLRKARGERPCLGCGRQIPPDRQANARYCSGRCRRRTWMRAKREHRNEDVG